MDSHALLEASLPEVDRVITAVCRRAHLSRDEADDFAAEVHLAMCEGDAAIVRQFDHRSSFSTYLFIVVQRLLIDYRNKCYGRWQASAEARRLGDGAVQLEALVLRDRRLLEEALPIVMARHGGTEAELRAMLDRLPLRFGRPRMVELDDADEATLVAVQSAEERTAEHEVRRMSDDVSAIMRAALGALSVEERMLVRFRYGQSRTVATIATMMQLPQRPLYRRLEALLARLRETLARHGIAETEAAALIGAAAQDMNFGIEEERP